MSRTIPKETWLALRRPDGTLEPLTQIDHQALTHLAIEAGLLGLSLEEWMLAILTAGAEENPAKHDTAEAFMGEPRIELSIPEGLLDELTWQQWDSWDHVPNLGESLTDWLYFVTLPGHVLLTARECGKRLAPVEVARKLIEDQSAKMALIEQTEVEEQERIEFERQFNAGIFQRPLPAAGGTLAAS